MNIKSLIDSMTPEERKIAASYLYELNKNEAVEQAKNIIINGFERDLVKSGNIIPAIKAVRDRVNCDIFTAKEVIEMYKDTL